MHSYTMTMSPHILSLWDVGYVSIDHFGNTIVCLAKDTTNRTITVCPVEHVESLMGLAWGSFNANAKQHRERPEAFARLINLDKAAWGGSVATCTQHAAVENGFRVSECKHCHARLEWLDWEWKEQA
jgi:hypothetical protein